MPFVASRCTAGKERKKEKKNREKLQKKYANERKRQFFRSFARVNDGNAASPRQFDAYFSVELLEHERWNTSWKIYFTLYMHTCNVPGGTGIPSRFHSNCYCRSFSFGVKICCLLLSFERG